MTKRLSVLLAAAIALAALSSPAQAQAPTKIRFSLDWLFQGNLAYFMFAKSGGYYAKQGLDVTVDTGRGSGVALSRVASGAYDFAAADLNTVIEFMGNNPEAANFKAVYLVYNRSPMLVQTLKRSGITEPRQLAGKTFAGPEADSTRRVFPIFARAVGIDPASVKWLTVDAGLRENMLARGDADAITGFEIDVLTLMERGIARDDIRTFKFRDYGVTLFGDVILATNKIIAENPKAVAAFISATNHAMIDSIAHPEQAAASVHDFDGLTDAKVDLAKLKIQLDVIDTDFAREHGLGDIDKAALATQIDQVAEIFHTKTKPSPDAIFDLRFLPPKPERVAAGALRTAG